MEKGMEKGIKALVMDYIEDGFAKEKIVAKLQKIYQLDIQKASEYYEKYSQNSSV